MSSYRSIYTGTQIDEFLTKAKELEEDILTKTPYIGENDNWFVWDNDNQIFVDTGITAKGYSGMYYGSEEPEPYEDGTYPVWILEEDEEMGSDIIDVCKMKFGSVLVSPSSFEPDDTYANNEFLFRAAIPFEQITETMVPDITPSLTEMLAGNLAPIANSFNGGIYIYVKEIPEQDIELTSVDVWLEGW